jgi:murein DD-endopeptidase MepM/ murein hydrolase activator NlpD
MGSGTFIWPVAPPIVINQEFWSAHPAIDIDIYSRQPIYAADSGTVIYADWSQAGYGNLVIIDHGNDFWTYYAHNETIIVYAGQGVLQGQQISEGGTTGNSTGNHLDFRVRYKAGSFHNPWLYLPPLP